MVLLLALLVLAAAGIAASISEVRSDGYGRWAERPRSHSWERDV